MRTPIAITGAGCVLPGAPDLASFTRLVLDGASAVGAPPEGRLGVPNARVLGHGRDQAWSLAGGYVERFVPRLEGLGVPDLERLDPLVHWLLHCSREALGGTAVPRTGAVFGNLSFPSDGMARWAEGLSRGTDPGDPRNHFMSGLPAAIVAEALGLDAGAWCLDAACASSIYAIKLACDALESGRADRMLAGAVQRADTLFLHVGFCQLGAMSKSGQSRPFHEEADGLVPAEGCVVFSLRRLDDALLGDEPILGVIRGVGLSNDGRGRSLLAPSSEGQQRAMRTALADAEVSPDTVQLFECHATGTPTGDRVEVDSLRAVYPGGALGSLKSNLGHLITTAGAAGLLKVLVAMRAHVMPATLHADTPIAGLGPFELLSASRPWAPGPAGVRRAAISAFGFGGNNGHLLVDEPPPRPAHPAAQHQRAVTARPPLAVLAMVDHRGASEATLPIEGLRFPPADLAASLAQQALALQAGRDAWEQANLSLHRDRVGVYFGMACDGLVTRWGLRWRMIHGDTPASVSPDALAPPLRAEHVVGTMPNIVANRLGVQVDAAGPGFTLSAEELSGLRALDAAWDALARGEIDAALVGAVDVAEDPRAVAARRALGKHAEVEGAVVVLVVARLGPANEARARAVLADDVEAPVVVPRPPRHGAADALVALVDVIHRDSAAVLQVQAIGGQVSTIGVRSGSRRPLPRPSPAPGACVRVPVLVPLPDLSRARTAPMQGTRLPRPPALVPTSIARPKPVTVPAVPAAPATPEPSANAEGAGAGAAAAYSQWRNAVVNSHASYLEQQARLHASFMATHAGMAQRMAAVAQGGLPPPGDLAPPLAAPAPAAVARRPTVVAHPTTPPAPAPLRPVQTDAPRLAPPAAPLPPPVTALPSVVPGRFELSRAELEMGAVGSISTIFGPDFAELDAYTRVVRMPTPPLLLADRVLDLDGPVRVLGKGSIVTETDIGPDAWYLHDGRMPGGLMIESGQADLLLGSWQGIDFLNRGERIYRLLGCTLTYKGELPRVGETLRYDIHIDQHAKLGDVRMFFFRYDCHVGTSPRLVVREGQAGFFSDAELAASGGVIWDAASHDPGPGQADPHVAALGRADLDRGALEAFAAGNLESAFGPAFARAHTHTWTPRVPGDRMLILDRVHVDADGGPWGRGYLRGELDIHPGLWFFQGHFHNDPCMPGTLMFDGCLQAMYILLAASGYTLHRDGWRFEPAKDITFKLRCRGQVIPSSKKLTYEIFVTERVAGPVPRLVAQVLCTVDGLKCFHADPLVVELVPDWPLSRPAFARHLAVTEPTAAFGWKQMLACAWGRPTDAFGTMYADFDGVRKVPRLPGPPYHFMSRVVNTTGEMGSKTAGCTALVEYDVPPGAWYFAESAHPVMPWAVLLEAALQPCGWLASWSGCAVGPDDFLFRNLDGTATIHREVTPGTGTLRTTSALKRVSKSGGMILVTFSVQVVSSAGPVVDMDTVFGFFPPEAFVNQVGVGSTEQERARIVEPGTPVPWPESPSLGRDRLRMLDRVFRLGGDRYRAEKDVSPKDWFFAAHFYQDPVQPGSLGIEALVQLLQVAMVDLGHCSGLSRPRFEPTASGEAQTWKYRGQVVPENRLIQSDIHVLEVRHEAGAVLCVAEGALWVDGKRIYAMPRFAVRVREDDRPATVRLACPLDHRPTWTLPAAPMMSMALAALSHGGGTALVDGMARRWLTWIDESPVDVPVGIEDQQVWLGEREAPYFTARLAAAAVVPEPSTGGVGTPTDGSELYESGTLFHGPGFHAVERIVARGAWGATVVLRPGLPPDVLLDGMTHAIPHDDITAWFPGLPPNRAAYPARLLRLDLLGALPAGASRVELRPLGADNGRPRVAAWLYDAEGTTPAAYFELEEVLLPKGPIGAAEPAARRAFLMGQYTPGVSLSQGGPEGATISASDVKLSDWLPGTVAAVYGSDEPKVILAKEVASAALGVHPRSVTVDALVARDRHRPLRALDLVASAPGKLAAASARFPDLGPTLEWWRKQAPPWPGEGVVEALTRAFLADLQLERPDALSNADAPTLFLANHETYLESVIFSALVPPLTGRPMRALAKVEHQTRWLGKLHALLTAYPGRRFAPQILWFDQKAPATLRPTIDALPRETSLLVHVEGTRQTRVGAPVEKVASIWIDYALARGMNIVPVAFRGGVAGERTEVPVAPQRVHVGGPISPAVLAAMPLGHRRQFLAEAINALPVGSSPTVAVATVADPGQAVVAAVERFAPGLLDEADPRWSARFRAIGGQPG